MAVFKNIDLHMHSVISDGTDTPQMLLEHVREAGIDLFSLTDHDALKGSLIIPGIRKEGDPCFITGIEFSCKDERGKYHILGYGYDPEAEPVREIVEKAHGFRIDKVKNRLRCLEEKFGISFPDNDLAALWALDNPGKPHIGNLMVKQGYVKTKEDGIREYINKVHCRTEYLTPEQAIRGILGGGGIPVLAHPSYGDGDQLIMGAEMDERIRQLMEYGLKGLEGFYSGFTKVIRREILGFAQRYGLYVTAGSDYHGGNKIIELCDTGLNEVTEWPAGLLRFLEDVRVEK